MVFHFLQQAELFEIGDGFPMPAASLGRTIGGAVHEQHDKAYGAWVTDCLLAVAREDETFEASGQSWSRPDWVNFGFGNGGLHYPGDLHSAETGEKLPIAKIPEGVKFRPGDESPYAGRASFYQLRYGPYLIGMNASADKSYALVPPEGLAVASAPDLVSGKPLPLNATVAPHSTVVLYLGQPN